MEKVSLVFIKRAFKGLLILISLVNIHSVEAQKILIVYYTESGHTELLGKEVARGVESVHGSELRFLSIDQAGVEDLVWADALILGSPVHSGNIAAPMMSFMRTWPFEGQEMKDKIGAAFVTAGGLSAGAEMAQVAILKTMLIFNMIVVGGPDWTSPFGASGIMGEGDYKSLEGKIILDDLFLKKGYQLGRRVTTVTSKLKK